MNDVWYPYREDGIIPKDIYQAELVKSEINFYNDTIILKGQKYTVHIDAGRDYYTVYDRSLLFCERFFNQNEVKRWMKHDFEDVVYRVSNSKLIPNLKELGSGAWLQEDSQKHLIIIACNSVIELIEKEFITINIEERLDI